MRTEFEQYIIDRVKEIRKEQGYGQRGIAEIIHCSRAFVGHVESNNPNYSHKYSMYQLFLIAKEFEVSMDDIFPPKNWEPSPATDSE